MFLPGHEFAGAQKQPDDELAARVVEPPFFTVDFTDDGLMNIQNFNVCLIKNYSKYSVVVAVEVDVVMVEL